MLPYLDEIFICTESIVDLYNSDAAEFIAAITTVHTLGKNTLLSVCSRHFRQPVTTLLICPFENIQTRLFLVIQSGKEVPGVGFTDDFHDESALKFLDRLRCVLWAYRICISYTIPFHPHAFLNFDCQRRFQPPGGRIYPSPWRFRKYVKRVLVIMICHHACSKQHV